MQRKDGEREPKGKPPLEVRKRERRRRKKSEMTLICSLSLFAHEEKELQNMISNLFK